jgi:hypothetical protein
LRGHGRQLMRLLLERLQDDVQPLLSDIEMRTTVLAPEISG